MKTIIKIFICLSLIYTPMFANAANVGGWNLSNAVAQGASTVYDATKNVVINGKDFVKDSWVKITPNATQVAKVLARGGAGYALSVAVEQLIGAVDWVLDPANNQIVYSKPDAPPCYDVSCLPPSAIQGYVFAGGPFSGEIVTSLSAACTKFDQHWQSNGGAWWGSTTAQQNPPACVNASGGAIQTFGVIVNPNYDPEAQEEEQKTLPLEVVAQKVISNANAGDAAAQVATTAAAADVVAEAEKDEAKARPIANQAEANAETKPADEAEAEKANEAQGQSKPNEANPEATDISLEFPVFCSWAPTVCEAAQVVISFPQTLTGWWESANQKADDWATSISDAYQDFMRDDELPNDDTKLDVSELPTPELQENAISWGASCPADELVPISLQGVSTTLVLSWTPWCQLLSVIKPAIIASAYIGAGFIVLGLRT